MTPSDRRVLYCSDENYHFSRKLAVASAVLILSGRGRDGADQQTSFDISSQSRAARRPFELTATQWAALKFEAVSERVFRSQLVTDGKIAVDEDHATPIFSPYAGRVTKLMAKPGDVVERGQTLCVIEVTDMVQAQNDFIAAVSALNKARSQLNLARIIEKRQRDLYEGKAAPLKEWQQAQAELVGAENDLARPRSRSKR